MLWFKILHTRIKNKKNTKRIFSRVFIYGFHNLSLSIYIYIYIIYAVISMIHKEKKETKINQQKKKKRALLGHML